MKPCDHIENQCPQDASKGAERLLIPDGGLHKTREGALKRASLHAGCWICTSLAEQRDVHEQIKSHFVEKPYLFQLPAPIWAVFQLRCPLTWKNSSFYFPKHSLINSSLLHMVSFLSPRLFLLSFPGASHSLF